MIDFAALSAPFPPHLVHWRIGSTNKDKTKGLALAYIDARDVMERLDEVCGPENWQCRYPHADGKTCCDIGIYSERLGAMVWKSNGAGDTDVEGDKGAFSDAFKRAAVLWGIGRYLYDLGNVWVEIEAKGKSHVIKDSEKPKLNRALHQLTANKPAPRTPEKPKEPDPFTDPAPDDDALTAKYQAALEEAETLKTAEAIEAFRDRVRKDIWPHLSKAEQQTLANTVAAQEATLQEKAA